VNILRIATQHHIKPIYYVSTLSVVSAMSKRRENSLTNNSKTNTTGIVLEEDRIPNKDYLDFMNGYGASKATAELILLNASSSLKIPLVIFRPGTISGDLKNGASNISQFLSRYLISIIQLGYSPDLDTVFDMAPADFVAKAICTLSTSENFGRIFHIFNIKKSLSLKQITNYIQQFGYSVKPVNFTEWRKILTEKIANGIPNELSPLMSYFSSSFPALNSYGNEDTQKELQKHNITCPEIEKAVLHKYVKYFISRGKIQKPPTEKS